MRFDYVHDAQPEAIEYLRSFRFAEPLRAPVLAIVTALIVVVSAWGIECVRVQQAQDVERVAEARLAQSRAALARTKLRRVRIEGLLALDRRLRAIRLSGTLLAVELADLANHVPDHAWLTSISREDAGVSLSGRAENLVTLSETIADLMSTRTAESPTLVRAGRDERDRAHALLSFEMKLQEVSDDDRPGTR